MAIVLPSGFKITNIDPVDDRLVVSNQAARLAFSTANVYEGMVVFQTDTNKLYVLINSGSPSVDASWQEVGAGAGFPYSGSAVITGSLFVSQSLTTGTVFTSSLQQGYTWVGGVNNISTLVSTSSFATITNPSDNRILTSDGTSNGIVAESNFTFDGNRATISGSLYVTSSVSSSLLLVSGSGSGSRVTIIGSGSSSPLFTVIGSQGELFSITDSLSGSLFSVNDISGLPVLEAFSDNRVLLGSYQAPALFTTVKITSVAGSNTIYSNIPTASYDGLFMDYTVRSGSNGRAGQMTALWSSSFINLTETTTTEFGNTDGVTFTIIVSGSNMAITGSTTTANWNIKAFIRAI